MKGTDGTISSYDYEDTVRVQTPHRPEGFDHPVDNLAPPYQNVIQYFVHCLETDQLPDGPLSPEICRIGQQIVDSAILSAYERRTVTLLP